MSFSGVEHRERCIVCSGNAIRALFASGTQSIGSDLRVLNGPLEKYACESCGFIFRAGAAPVDFTTSSYALYDHAPGESTESARQAQYAHWLLDILGTPETIFEAGCGNGSLLASLTALAPSIRVRGLEPAPGAAEAARQAGFSVTTGSLEYCSAGESADVAIAINVIEHVEDPREFLRALARHGDRVVVCCPDGSTPNTELLFADHRWSFVPAHMKKLFADVGLEVETQVSAPVALGEFFLTVGRKPRTLRAYDAYLAAWARLDDVLMTRTDGRPTYCFGAGEAAGLLRAHAPRLWKHVQACVVDAPTRHLFGEVPIVALADFPSIDVLVLGVHPRSQPAVAQRLRGVARNLVRWDDVIRG